MDKRISLIVLAVCSPLVLACLFIDSGWSVALLAGLVVAHPVALIALGASRQGSLGPLRPYLAALAVWFFAAFFLLVHPPAFLAGRTFLGAPWSAVLMLAGLWALPMVWTTLAYLKTFSSFGLSDRDLARIRSAPPSREP